MFTVQKKLQSAAYYKKLVPLSDRLQVRKETLDNLLKDNFVSRTKFVTVCGPCSADNPIAMNEYLVRLQKTLSECPNLLGVGRIYTSKPHSNGVGYKGSVFQLTSENPVDIEEGIIRCRKMMIRSLEIGLPVADELLYPELYECFDDLVSYWFVGARSSEDSLHREMASGLEVCCGVKNATDGDIEKVVDSLYAVSHPCYFPYKGSQIATNGCKYAHIVLRGGYRDGKFLPNIGNEQINFAKKLLRSKCLNDFVLTDLNHANSGKVASNQIANAKIALNSGADGVMIESYLYAGGQSKKYGTSQTDDCLDFEETEQLLKYLDLHFANTNK